MVVIVQGNLNRSRTANNLWKQLMLEKMGDILIISEQYRDTQILTWFKDISGTAAIWVLIPDKVPIVANGSGNGYVWLRSKSITFVSCYLIPNEPITDFQAKMGGIEDAIQNLAVRVVIARDFNARATE